MTVSVAAQRDEGPTVAAQPSSLDRRRVPPVVHIDASWRPLIEEVCILKEAIDLARMDLPIARRMSWVSEALHKVGIEVDDFEDKRISSGLGMPHSFMKLVMGSWCSYGEESSEIFRGLAEMPEWAIVGWLRLEQYGRTSSLTQAMIVQKAKAVLAAYNDREKVLTYGFEGLPLMWAGEGKNRTQLFRLAGLARRSELILYPRPDLSGFTGRRLLGKQGFTVLSGAGQTNVLPFGDLSRRLLTAMGVRWSDLPTLAGWTEMRTAGGEKLGLTDLAKIGRDEKRLRLALVGGLGLAGLEGDEE